MKTVEEFLAAGGVIKQLPPAPAVKIDTRNSTQQLLSVLTDVPKHRRDLPLDDQTLRAAVSNMRKHGLSLTIKDGWYSL